MLIERVRSHLRSVGFSAYHSDLFSKQFRRWVHCSGPEWTCKRMKSLKEYHLQKLSGVAPAIPAGWAVTSTRHRKSVFADPTVRMVMDLEPTAVNLRKIEAFLRVHQVLKLAEVSQGQMDKFIKAVTSPYEGDPDSLESASNAVRLGIKRLLSSALGKTLDMVKPVPLRLWSPSDKRAPVLKSESLLEGKPWTIVSRSRNTVETHVFVDLLQFDTAWQAVWRRYPMDVSRSMVGDGELIGVRSSLKETQHDFPCGKIGFIQESGCKLRSVANPFLAVQALGEPLKRKLEAISKNISVIGTFNQSSSHDTIIKWIQEGLEISSYDMTSFTDRFPYSLQQIVLDELLKQGLISQFDIDIVNTVVSKSWSLPDSLESVRWAVGQPLGFGPSFHLATLTHAALLSGIGCSPHLYRVVGDDVAIGHRESAIKYSALMTGMGVEIAQAKSIISSDYAEFCGKLMTKEGVIPSIKVRVIRGSDQLVDALSYYGPRAIDFLSRSERLLLLKAFLPIDLGGLGWKPPGISYVEFVNSLRTDAIAEHRLRRDLEDFLGSVYMSWEALIGWVSEFDKLNRLVDSETRLQGMSPKGITGISASNLYTHGRVQGPSSDLGRFTFFDIEDEAVRRETSGFRKLPEWLKLRYFNRFGYIESTDRQRVKPPTAINWKENHGKADDKPNRFFRKGYRS